MSMNREKRGYGKYIMEMEIIYKIIAAEMFGPEGVKRVKDSFTSGRMPLNDKQLKTVGDFYSKNYEEGNIGLLGLFSKMRNNKLNTEGYEYIDPFELNYVKKLIGDLNQ